MKIETVDPDEFRALLRRVEAIELALEHGLRAPGLLGQLGTAVAWATEYNDAFRNDHRNVPLGCAHHAADLRLVASQTDGELPSLSPAKFIENDAFCKYDPRDTAVFVRSIIHSTWADFARAP